MPKKRMHVQASASRGRIENALDNEGVDVGNLVFDGNIISKFFPISSREFFFNTHGNYFDNSKRAQIFGKTGQVG
jgi:hypothetical protein